MRQSLIGSILVMLAIVLLSLPDQIEGPILIHISPGHALSLLDTIAMIPLLSGIAVLQLFIWRRRTVLAEHFRRNVPISVLVTFAGGFGMGLLLASAFSLFLWWWAIGASLLLFVFLVLLSIIAK